ncbi:hypothetical protein [Microbacterium sp. NPDC080220]|uniref:hypothetical protein n=1 Tax=Microbacterium sp. NPDC080220 TaxID=3161017 RepID=UPI00344AD817
MGSIEQTHTTTVAEVDWTDDFKVVVKLTDPNTQQSVEVGFSLADSAELADQVMKAHRAALDALSDSVGGRVSPMRRHGFDTDGPVAS